MPLYEEKHKGYFKVALYKGDNLMTGNSKAIEKWLSSLKIAGSTGLSLMWESGEEVWQASYEDTMLQNAMYGKVFDCKANRWQWKNSVRNKKLF